MCIKFDIILHNILTLKTSLNVWTEEKENNNINQTDYPDKYSLIKKQFDELQSVLDAVKNTPQLTPPQLTLATNFSNEMLQKVCRSRDSLLSLTASKDPNISTTICELSQVQMAVMQAKQKFAYIQQNIKSADISEDMSDVDDREIDRPAPSGLSTLDHMYPITRSLLEDIYTNALNGDYGRQVMKEAESLTTSFLTWASQTIIVQALLDNQRPLMEILPEIAYDNLCEVERQLTPKQLENIEKLRHELKSIDKHELLDELWRSTIQETPLSPAAQYATQIAGSAFGQLHKKGMNLMLAPPAHQDDEDLQLIRSIADATLSESEHRYYTNGFINAISRHPDRLETEKGQELLYNLTVEILNNSHLEQLQKILPLILACSTDVKQSIISSLWTQTDNGDNFNFSDCNQDMIENLLKEFYSPILESLDGDAYLKSAKSCYFAYRLTTNIDNVKGIIDRLIREQPIVDGLDQEIQIGLELEAISSILQDTCIFANDENDSFTQNKNQIITSLCSKYSMERETIELYLNKEIGLNSLRVRNISLFETTVSQIPPCDSEYYQSLLEILAESYANDEDKYAAYTIITNHNTEILSPASWGYIFSFICRVHESIGQHNFRFLQQMLENPEITIPQDALVYASEIMVDEASSIANFLGQSPIGTNIFNHLLKLISDQEQKIKLYDRAITIDSPTSAAILENIFSSNATSFVEKCLGILTFINIKNSTQLFDKIIRQFTIDQNWLKKKDGLKLFDTIVKECVAGAEFEKLSNFISQLSPLYPDLVDKICGYLCPEIIGVNKQKCILANYSKAQGQRLISEVLLPLLKNLPFKADSLLVSAMLNLSIDFGFKEGFSDLISRYITGMECSLNNFRVSNQDLIDKIGEKGSVEIYKSFTDCVRDYFNRTSKNEELTNRLLKKINRSILMSSAACANHPLFNHILNDLYAENYLGDKSVKHSLVLHLLEGMFYDQEGNQELIEKVFARIPFSEKDMLQLIDAYIHLEPHRFTPEQLIILIKHYNGPTDDKLAIQILKQISRFAKRERFHEKDKMSELIKVVFEKKWMEYIPDSIINKTLEKLSDYYLNP